MKINSQTKTRIQIWKFASTTVLSSFSRTNSVTKWRLQTPGQWQYYLVLKKKNLLSFCNYHLHFCKRPHPQGPAELAARQPETIAPKEVWTAHSFMICSLYSLDVFIYMLKLWKSKQNTNGYFLRQLGLFGGFDREDTQGRTKPSIENKTNPDVLCQLRGIKGGKKKRNRKEKSVF